MTQAKPPPGQLGFDFEAPIVPEGEAALAGFEQRTNVLVGQMLNSDGRSREEIAAAATAILGEKVSKKMLDAYSSPAREDHKVPFSRLMALVVVTNRFDLLDRHMRETGCGVVFGEEIDIVRLGAIDREMKALQEERRHLRSRPTTMRKGSDD